jgi:hypothetical protein
MASTINADDGVVSGSAGVKTSADNSGVLELQSNGTTQFTLGSSSVVINEAGADVDFRVEGDTDANLLFVDASTDRVGVGTGTPGSKLDVNGNGNFSGTLGATLPSSVGSITLRNSSTTSSELHVRPASGKDGWLSFTEDTVADRWIIGTKNGNGGLFFNTGSPGSNTDRMTLDSSGNLGVGTTSPQSDSGYGGFTVNGANGSIITLRAGGSNSGRIYTTGTDNFNIDANGTASTNILFRTGTSSTERARITAAGNFGLGTSSPACLLHVNGAATDDEGLVKIQNTNDGGAVFFPALNVINTRGNHSYGIVSTFSMSSSTDADRPSILIYSGQAAHSWQIGMITSGWGTNDEFGIGYRASNTPGTFSSWPTRYFSIATNGNVNIANALSKGSGSFKIDHPLKPETHHLVHSFIEGPQADLIYRGKVALNEGKATINIDVAAGMTEGTFVALCREVQCLTSNESDWDAVRGTVAGNILTIECQNANSSATVSWLVIGERQDQHMYDTSWTDENGKVIVEPEKPESK